MERLEENLPAAAARATWAIVRTGGKQYVVRAGDRLDVERSDFLASVARDEDGRRLFAFDDVLMVGSGERTVVGTPHVPNARVVAELLPEKRGPKVVAFKKRRRQASRRKRGHRQILQPLRVVSVEADRAGASEYLGWLAAEPAAHPSPRPPAVADVLDLLPALRWGNPGQVAGALRAVAGASWHGVPDRQLREVTKALEPLLTSADARIRAASTLALAAAMGVPPEARAAPEAVADALTRHFARTGRRHFVETSLRADASGGTAPGGPIRYQARVALRDRLDLPSGNVTVRLARSIPACAHVEVNVTGPGVYLGTRRTVIRGERPEGTLREVAVDFENDPRVSDSAILDVVVDGRRIERRFLSLSRLGITREPPPPPAAEAAPAGAHVEADTSIPSSPVQESASIA